MTSRPRINIIVAITSDGAIGRRGDLIYHVSADLRRFKQLTMGHPIIMGRKTFESLPGGALPGRRNIIVSRNADYRADGAETVTSLDEAVRLCAADDDIFIIGGAQIYNEAYPMANRLMLTRFDSTVDDADTFFPEIDMSQWHVDECGEWAVDERSGVKYKFETLTRCQ